MPKMVSECSELVKLYRINRGGLVFLRHSVVLVDTDLIQFSVDCGKKVRFFRDTTYLQT